MGLCGSKGQRQVQPKGVPVSDPGEPGAAPLAQLVRRLAPVCFLWPFHSPSLFLHCPSYTTISLTWHGSQTPETPHDLMRQRYFMKEMLGK